MATASSLARSTITVLVAWVVGAISAAALAVVIAAKLGAETSGLYYVAFSVASIAAIIGKLGLDTPMMRFIAVAASESEGGSMAGAYRQGVSLALATSGFLALVVALGAPVLAESIFDKPEAVDVLRVAALWIPIKALMVVHAQSLRAIEKPVEAAMLEVAAPPLAAAILIWFLFSSNEVAAMWAVVISWSVFLLGLMITWFNAARPVLRFWGAFDFSLLVRTSLPLLVVSSMGLVIQWSDVVILGVLRPAADVGVYAPMLRLIAVVTLVRIAVNSVISPRFAVLHQAGDRPGLERAARAAAFISLVGAVPVFILIQAGAPAIQSVLGDDFAGATAVIRILAIGALVDASVGSVGMLLTMTGHQRYQQRTMLAAAALNIGLNLLLIPRFGINGAAAATAASVSLANLANASWARRKLHIEPVWPRRPLAAGVAE